MRNIKQFIRLQMGKDQTPGVVILLSSPKIGIKKFSLGYAALPPSAKKMSVLDNFRVASISKTFLATMILQQVEKGKLNLNTKIIKYLPDNLDLSEIKNIFQVTLKQLLNMTSGIPEYYDADVDEYLATHPYKTWSPSSAISFSSDLQSKFKPGKGYEYSNTNYALLQLILRKVTGKNLADNLEELISKPLKLSNTFADDFKMSPFTLTTKGYDTKHEKIDVSTFDDGFGIGDTFVITNAEDLNKFIDALLVKKSLLKPKLLTKMLQANKFGRYGMGIEVINIQRWGYIYSHNGLVNGYQTNYFYLPRFKLTIIILTNNRATTIIEPSFVKIMYYYQKYFF